MAANDINMEDLGQKRNSALHDALVPGISALIFAVLLIFALKDADVLKKLWPGRRTAARSVRPPAPPRTAVTPKVQPEYKARVQPPKEPEKLPPQVQAAMPSFEMKVPVLPFPQSVAVRSGMRKAELVTTYGKPAFSATWYDKSGVTEKYLYLDQKNVTSVVIQNGKVSSSTTEDSANFSGVPLVRPPAQLE